MLAEPGDGHGELLGEYEEGLAPGWERKELAHRGRHQDSPPSANWANPVTSHTVNSASVGDMREARNAGHSPATAPMRIAAPMPPAQASAGMIIASDLLDA